jgi:hypothetical protein
MSSSIPFEALEGLMRKAFIEGEAEPGLFWDAFLKANLYVPVSTGGETGYKPGPQKAEGLEEFPVLLGVDSSGNHVLWLFTSPHVMSDYTERDLAYLELPAPTILSNLIDSDYEVVLIGPERLTLSLHPDSPFSPTELNQISKLLRDFMERGRSKYLIYHTAKYDMHVFRRVLGVSFVNHRVYDVAAGEFCLDENRKFLRRAGFSSTRWNRSLPTTGTWPTSMATSRSQTVPDWLNSRCRTCQSTPLRT